MHSAANVEILRLVQAHKALLPTASSDGGSSPWRRFVDALNIKPGMFGMNIDLKMLFGRHK